MLRRRHRERRTLRRSEETIVIEQVALDADDYGEAPEGGRSA